jgi:hypothetical protein
LTLQEVGLKCNKIKEIDNRAFSGVTNPREYRALSQSTNQRHNKALSGT